MTAHLLYIVGCSVRNGLMRHVRRLRSPRYAIAALVGLLYFFSIFGGWLPADEAGEHLGGVWLGFADRLGPLMLALLTARWWLWRGRQFGLRLTPAETHLLLPAPISRAGIIRFKLLQAQPALLLSALIATFLTRGTELIWPLRVFSVWLLLATLHQHQIAASLVHVSAQQHGRSGIRAHLVPLALFGVAFVTLGRALLAAVADIRARPSVVFARDRIIDALDERAVHVVLSPFRLLLRPLLAESAVEWLPVFAAGLVVLAVHYAWVVRTDAAFEEAAIARGEYLARLQNAARSGGMSRIQLLLRDRRKRLSTPWLPLRPTGRSAYAVFWKNVLQVQRSLGLTTVWALFILLIAVSGSLGSGDAPRAIAFILLMFSALLLVIGPVYFRNDLRTDLAWIDLLRTYPISGRNLVAAGAAAAVLCITLAQLFLLWAGVALLAFAGTLAPAAALLAGTSALVVLPFINALSVLIQNGFALLYPSWVRIGEVGGGVEMMGQSVVLMVGSLLMLVLLAVPPVAAGALVGAPLAMWIGTAGLAAGAAAALAAAGAEVVLLTRWLGRLYDRTDPVTAGLLR